MQYPLNDVREFMQAVTVYRLATHTDTRNKFMEYYGHAFDAVPPCMGCPGELESAIHKMHWLLRMHDANQTILIKAMAITKYTMRPNTRVYSFKLGMMVTPYNCTDDVAQTLIDENGANAALFTINLNYEAGEMPAGVPVEPMVVPAAPKKLSIGKKSPEPEAKPVAVTTKKGKKRGRKVKNG